MAHGARLPVLPGGIHRERPLLRGSSPFGSRLLDPDLFFRTLGAPVLPWRALAGFFPLEILMPRFYPHPILRGSTDPSQKRKPAWLPTVQPHRPTNSPSTAGPTAHQRGRWLSSASMDALMNTLIPRWHTDACRGWPGCSNRERSARWPAELFPPSPT